MSISKCSKRGKTELVSKVNHIESEESPSQVEVNDDKEGEEDFYINQMGIIKSIEEPEMAMINKDKIENSSGFIILLAPVSSSAFIVCPSN